MQLFRWEVRADDSRELALECSHAGHTIVLFLATRGDFILVGGLPIRVCVCARLLCQGWCCADLGVHTAWAHCAAASLYQQTWGRVG